MSVNQSARSRSTHTGPSPSSAATFQTLTGRLESMISRSGQASSRRRRIALRLGRTFADLADERVGALDQRSAVLDTLAQLGLRLFNLGEKLFVPARHHATRVPWDPKLHASPRVPARRVSSTPVARRPQAEKPNPPARTTTNP